MREIWQAVPGSALRPPDYKSDALTRQKAVIAALLEKQFPIDSRFYLMFSTLSGVFPIPIKTQRSRISDGRARALLGGCGGSTGSGDGGLKGFQVGTQASIADLPRVTQTLVAPPFLPEHTQVADGGPKVVQIEMVILKISL